MPTRLDSISQQRRLLCVIALALTPITAPPAGAQEPSTPEVFRRFSDAVAKVEVVELASAAKASIGSGFFVDPRGDLITNYHVVAELVREPERYRTDLIDASGAVRNARVVAVDVVHDLAVLSSGEPPPLHLELSEAAIEKGLRLYALGHPADLGLSIVEGTYNGLLEHTLYDRIHFTGSLNPGMSGGPAITDGGEVVGINVSTAGNQLSFLVPAARASALLEEERGREDAEAPDFDELIGTQLREHQRRYFRRMLEDTLPTVAIGGYRVPTRPADFFNCWGDVLSAPDDPYEMRSHECSTDDYIYIAPEHSSGTFTLEHTVLASEELNLLRFFALYNSEFQGSGRYLGGRESDVTAFRCRPRNVGRAGLKLRVSFCARAYRRYRDLYDVVLTVAALGSVRRGLVSTVVMSGVDFENAQRLAELYLGAISWEM